MVQVFKRYVADCVGASAVEFALMAPILIFILIGTVDAGRYVHQRMQMTNAAHTTASYVAQAGDDANAQTVASESYGGDFDDIAVVSEFECECSDGEALACPVACGADDFQRRFVRVAASGTFSPVFPYPVLSEGLTLQSSVRMRVD
ncbi:MAG: TadE/TadG family type IV pilus assembly protein [Bdellovibrionales bacterium]